MPSPFRSAGFRWFVVAPTMFVAFVVSFGFVTFHVVRATTIPQRDTLVAELDAKEPGWRAPDLIADRNARLPPPEQNAAELGYQAQQKLPKTYRDWEKQPDAGQWRSDLKNPHLPHRADVADLRKQLWEGREAVELARGIRQMPGGGLRIKLNEQNPLSTLLPKHQELRQTFSLLSSDALLLAYDRQGDRSVDSCHAILASARGLGDDPWLIGQLIRIAGVTIAINSLERTLAWSVGFDDARLSELDRAFAGEAGEPRLVWGFRGERATFDLICANIDNGTLSLAELADGRPGFFEQLQTAPFRARLPAEHAAGLEMFNKLIVAASKPAGRERTESLTAIEVESTKLARSVGGPRYILLGLLIPAVSRMCEADNRCIANLNAARVAIACERHRQKTGTYPEKLDELPKELLAEVPLDPFSGQPIRYKKLSDGAVAYSTGGDGVDDGAAKLDPKNEKGNDLGFRLWTPEHRRQPPEPKKAEPPETFAPFWNDPPQKPGTPTAPPPLSPWVRKE